MSARDPRPDDERLPAELAGALAAALPETPGARERVAALRERLLTRVHRDLERSPRVPTTTRAAEGEWRELVPGVFEKLLFIDHATGTRSYLLRGGPGARVPAHAHRGAEECLLLEGDFRVGETQLRPGDYHVAPGGTAHPMLSSDTGFVAFLREPLRRGEG